MNTTILDIESSNTATSTIPYDRTNYTTSSKIIKNLSLKALLNSLKLVRIVREFLAPNEDYIAMD